MATGRVGVVWEGEFGAHHSLANVNHAVATRLAACERVDVGLIAADPPDRQLPGGLADRIGHLPDPIHCHVRHRWPPDLRAPARGSFVLVQPWEYPSVPVAWVEAIRDHVDELWVHSTFVRDAYVHSGVDPATVRVIPLGVDPDRFHPRATPALHTRPGPFRFLFVGGTLERKGFDLLLQAYLAEFSRADDVVLVVKDFYYGGDVGALVRDLSRRRTAPEIDYTYGETAHGDLGALFASCDCYVHPYRAEGFGLPILEAMACGLPVVVTGAGPALDYCDEDNAYLLPARPAPVPPAIWPEQLPTVHPPSWYEPDRAVLQRLLRHVVDHPAEARARGAAGSLRVHERYTWSHTVDRVVDRLERLATERGVRR